MKKLLYLLLAPLFLMSFKTDKPAYQLFNSKGKSISYEKMLKELAKADVVFFGEQHNDPIAHWLQLELAQDLHLLHKGNLVIGAEMWETDTQAAVDSFLLDQLAEPAFLERSRAWPNYATDYKPILSLAREHQIKVIATNAPRRLARVVAREGLKGLNTLPQTDKQWLAMLPLMIDMELPGYKKMRAMFGDAHGASVSANQIIEAQALKDVTMAQSIHQNLKQGQRFLHLNGSYHSDHHEGILWYLKHLRPELKVMTISTVSQAQLEKLEQEHVSRADIILAVPATMTKTY